MGRSADGTGRARVITHRVPLAEAPHGHDVFEHEQEGCETVVLRP